MLSDKCVCTDNNYITKKQLQIISLAQLIHNKPPLIISFEAYKCEINNNNHIIKMHKKRHYRGGGVKLDFRLFFIVWLASTQCRKSATRGMASQHLQTFEKINCLSYIYRVGQGKCWLMKGKYNFKINSRNLSQNSSKRINNCQFLAPEV